jgi:hypothetical protein
MAHVGRVALVLVVALAGQLLAGCENSPSRATGPTADKQAAQGVRKVSLPLRDRFLYDHNAAFFGGRTGRWITPIPLYLTGDPSIDQLLVGAAQVWEGPLAGTAGVPFYQPLGPPGGEPQTGIFFAIEDLPGNVIGFADPHYQGTQGSGARLLRRVRANGLTARRVELPQVLPSGEIRRCAIILDPALAVFGETALRTAISHEVGHCLGFIGHVSSGLMRRTCCASNLTSNVVRMMNRLYSLPPGTVVTP